MCDFMTATSTIQRQLAPQSRTDEVLTFTLTAQTLDSRVDSLVRKLLESNAFSVEQQSQIRELASTIRKLDNQEDVAVTLCYLLFTFVHPAILSSPAACNPLLDVETEVKELLKDNIPEGKNVEDYIDERSEEQSIINQIASIENIFQVLKEHLYSSANKVNSHMAKNFEDLKANLLAIKESMQSDNAKLREKVDSLIEEVKEIIEKTLKETSSMKELGERVDQQQQSMQQIISKGL